jgi:hypothetical protein
MALVDDAEKVALRIFKHDEVGIVRVIPTDLGGAEGNEPICLGDLLPRTTNVQIEVHARVRWSRSIAQLKSDPGCVIPAI